jgi:4-hydroxy-2-oxoheptanedioate aldolase
MELGVPGEFGHQSIIDAYAAVIASCREHGKWPGMGGVYAEPLLTRYIGMGMRLILGGSDTGMLIQAASQRSNFLRGLLDSQAVPKAVPRPRSNE